MSLQILPKNLKILYMVPFHVNSSANSLQNPPKSPKIPKIPLKMCLKLCGAEVFWPGQCATLELQSGQIKKGRPDAKIACREKPGQLAEFVKYHPKINFTYVTVLEMANTLWYPLDRIKLARIFKSLRDCQKPDPKKPLSIQKLKLKPIGSKTTCCVKQCQHIQGSRIDQRSQQFNSCKLFGIVVFLATKIKESTKISGKHFWKFLEQKWKNSP